MEVNLALTEAAKCGHNQAVTQALRDGADANAEIEGWTPLFWAAQEGHSEIVGQLLKAGANVNACDAGGFTPLKQAVSLSHVDIVDQLLLHGADVHHRCHSDGGCTVLHTAAAYGLVACIELLLQRGANRNVLNDARQTPYDVAVECGEENAAVLLRGNNFADRS